MIDVKRMFLHKGLPYARQPEGYKFDMSLLNDQEISDTFITLLYKSARMLVDGRRALDMQDGVGIMLATYSLYQNLDRDTIKAYAGERYEQA